MKKLKGFMCLVGLLFVMQPFSVSANEIIVEGVNKEFVDSVNMYYEVVPECIREHFAENEWVIRLSHTNLGEKYFKGELSVLAVTVLSEQSIYLDASKNSEESVIHEMGHYLDYSLGFLSQSEEFKRIHSLELNSFRNIHYTHIHNTETELEYFAEAFQTLLLEPQNVAMNCPETYGFITACIQMIE